MIANPFTTITQNEVDKMAVPMTAVNFVYYTESKQFFRKTVYKIDEPIFKQIESVFSGKKTNTISKGDKVYVLPGHSMTNQRIKDYIKSIGASITKDITKATVVAGSKGAIEKTDKNQNKLSSLLIELNYYYKFYDTDTHSIDYSLECFPTDTFELLGLKESIKEDHLNGIETFFSTEACNNMNRWRFNKVSHWQDDAHIHFMSSEGVEILYHILSKKLPVVTDSYISDQANSSVKLEDNDVYDAINSMLSSSDKKDQNIGLEMLSTCSLEGAYTFNAWRLARKHKWAVSSGVKSKGLKFFIETTNFMSLAYTDENEILKLLKEKEELTDFALNEILNREFQKTIDNHSIADEEYEIYETVVDHSSRSITLKIKDEVLTNFKNKEDV